MDDAGLWMIQLDAMYLIFDFEDLPRYLEGFALFTRKYDFFYNKIEFRSLMADLLQRSWSFLTLPLS